MPDPIELNETDARTGLALWLECERLHDQYHAAQAAFGRWADGLGKLYGVPQGYVIGNPLQGFVPGPEVTHGG